MKIGYKVILIFPERRRRASLFKTGPTPYRPNTEFKLLLSTTKQHRHYTVNDKQDQEAHLLVVWSGITEVFLSSLITI